jgi:hypothetical protein
VRNKVIDEVHVAADVPQKDNMSVG